MQGLRPGQLHRRGVQDRRDTKRVSGDPRGQQKLIRVQPGDPDSVRDWQFGNPLTFNDLVAARYGDMRFGHGEGFNDAMVKRFKLLKTKGYYRTKARAELHCVMVFAGIHALTRHQQDLKGAYCRQPTLSPRNPLFGSGALRHGGCS